MSDPSLCPHRPHCRPAGRAAALALGLLLTTTGCGTRVHEAAPATTSAPGLPANGTLQTAASQMPATERAQEGQAPSTQGGSAATSAALESPTGPGSGGPSAAAGPSKSPSAASIGGSPSRGATTPPGQPARPAGPSSGTNPGPGTSLPAPADSCGQNPSTVKIGAVGQQSGPVGGAFIPGVRAVQSWVNLINSQGGLRCHPVRYLVDDDGGDPARHMALVRKQVEQEQILAFVYMDAGLNGRTSVKYITDKRVPVIGDETGSDWFYESPMYFPQATSGLSTTEAVVAMGADIGKPQNKTKLALLTCVEADVCRQTASNGEAWAKKYGLTLSYRGQVSLGQPDFTAECLAARNAGSELLYVVVEAASLRRAATSCDRVDFHPIYMVTGGQSDVSLAKDPNLDGLAVSLIVRPWFLTGAPAVAEHQAVMVKYGVEPGPQTMVGWVAAKLFELATQKLAEPPTRESVLDGLWSVKNNDLGGLTYPMTFTRDQNAPRVLCYWQTRTKAGEWVSPDAGARQCR